MSKNWIVIKECPCGGSTVKMGMVLAVTGHIDKSGEVVVCRACYGNPVSEMMNILEDGWMYPRSWMRQLPDVEIGEDAETSLVVTDPKEMMRW